MNCFVSIGTYLSMKNKVVQPNSIVSLSDIGAGETALKCITDRIMCCLTPTPEGEWYFPLSINESAIPSGRGAVFSRNRTDNGVVNLNRITDAIPLIASGLYCCRVRDAVNAEQSVCVEIGNENYDSAIAFDGTVLI